MMIVDDQHWWSSFMIIIYVQKEISICAHHAWWLYAMLMYDVQIWQPYARKSMMHIWSGYSMSIHADHMWWSGDYIRWSSMMMEYAHAWWSCMAIMCDDDVWHSCMMIISIIIHDHHTWESWTCVCVVFAFGCGCVCVHVCVFAWTSVVLIPLFELNVCLSSGNGVHCQPPLFNYVSQATAVYPLL